MLIVIFELDHPLRTGVFFLDMGKKVSTICGQARMAYFGGRKGGLVWVGVANKGMGAGWVYL